MQDGRIELLQAMPVFGGIRPDIVRFLLDICELVRVPANAFFFREGEEADSMFVLEAGEAAVLRSCLGKDYLLRTLRAGDCFGELAVMDLCPRSASVRAVNNCAAIRLSAANLYEVCTRDPKQFALVQMNMGREVARRFREADDRLFHIRMGLPEADERFFVAT